MKKIIGNIYVGDTTDCANTMSSSWSIIHACKHPCFMKVARAGNVTKRGNNLYLDMVDVSETRYYPINLFVEALKFIKNELDRNQKVLVHCNMGFSRAPTIVLLYVALVSKQIQNGTFWQSYDEFSARLYPQYRPSSGIMTAIDSMWSDLKTIFKGD